MNPIGYTLRRSHRAAEALKPSKTNRDWGNLEMAQTYTFQIFGDPEEKFRTVQRLARSKGVTLSGDSTRAMFSGLVTGSYTRSGSIVTVTITGKPMIVGWPKIESMLRDFLES